MAGKLATADDLYSRDFDAWTQNQAAKLRARASVDDCGDIDRETAAAEIDSRPAVLVLHPLKWRSEVAHRSTGWSGTIRERRRRFRRLLADSASLRACPGAVLDDVYASAAGRAVEETGLRADLFPPACPFTIEQVLDPDFHPEAA